jgi:hypothetical protein
VGSSEPTGGAPSGTGSGYFDHWDKRIVLSDLGSYDTPLFDEGAVEIVAYDAHSKRAFLTFAEQPRIEVIDLSNPASPFLTHIIDLTPWGATAHATSVAVRDRVLAAAVPQGAEDTGPGKVLFFNVYGSLLNEVTVGALPDMVTFSPNGRFVLTANEGQPLSDYSFDPEGSVSIIDLACGVENLTQADVTTAGFAAFNAPAHIDPRIRIFGPGASVAQDLEPEYIAIADDSKTAWVTLQENNALGIIDLKKKKVTSLVALGYKHHLAFGHGLDASIDSAVSIKRWPVLGMYMPDAIAAFEKHGETFLVTANEGDVREYDGLNAPKDDDTNEEAIRIEDVTLDPRLLDAFPTLQDAATGIGRLNVTSFHGDTNHDGLVDRLFAFGARSFSVWTDRGRLVWDSGDDLEQITAKAFPANFNASNTSNAIDNRSDDKGPEPEGIAVANLWGRDYVFVALERIGGVVVYDIENPRWPRFVQYINVRDFTQAPSSALSKDQGAEGLVVVQPRQKAGRGFGRGVGPWFGPGPGFGTGFGWGHGPGRGGDDEDEDALLLVANEVSGTLRVFRIARAN